MTAKLAASNWRSRTTISVEEAASLVGISRSSAYEAARTGELPTLRIGRRFLVPVAKLRTLLGENEIEARAGNADLEKLTDLAGHDEDYSR